MNTIRKEVRELISINERIQSAMLKGDQFTDDEKGLVEMCASELIASARRESGDGAQFLRPVDGSRVDIMK